jgi:AcrR family transcriptional regulator
MGRSRAFDEGKALKKIMVAFWRHGFAETSIKDLELASGLSSGSLYNSFGGKDELFECAILHYMEQVVEPRLNSTLRTSDAITGLKAYLNETIEPENDNRYLGCLVLNAHLNAFQLPPAVRKLVFRCQAQVDQAIEACISRAQSEEQLSSKIDAGVLARQVSLMLSGRALRRRLHAGRGAGEGDFRAIMALFEQ